MYYVYVIRSAESKKLYIGHTDNLEQRLFRHRHGHSRATRYANDWQLVYHESFASRAEAMKRELFLKSGRGRSALALKGI
jgi:putative endonuclease